MWVSEFGGHVELEVVAVLNGAVSELDADGTALLEGLFEQQRFQHGVEFLTDVFHQDRSSELDAVLQGSHKVSVGEFDDV